MPLSFYSATPTPLAGEWLGHSLAAINKLFQDAQPRGGPAAPAELRGLGTATKAIALQLFGVERQIGVTQWTNPDAVRVHARISSLQLLTADQLPRLLPDLVGAPDRRLRLAGLASSGARSLTGEAQVGAGAVTGS